MPLDDETLLRAVEESDNPTETINHLIGVLASALPFKGHPIAHVQWVPVEQVAANDYNPNSVALHEMRLLHTSIAQDGYTQPVVTIYDPARQKYVIVDGFHRYTIMRTQADIAASTGGLLPVVVLDKGIIDRMAATIRHNRARGKHSVAGMSSLVFTMLREGATDDEVRSKVGLEQEELDRLKHITGFSKLFENTAYGQAWEGKRQLLIKAAWAAEHPDDPPRP